MTDIIERLEVEAGLCRNETATDIAMLLDEAALEIGNERRRAQNVRKELSALDAYRIGQIEKLNSELAEAKRERDDANTVRAAFARSFNAEQDENDALRAALERIGDATHDFKRSAYDVIAIIRGIAKDAVGRGTERAAIQPTVAHPECICPTCGIRHGGGGRAGDF